MCKVHYFDPKQQMIATGCGRPVYGYRTVQRMTAKIEQVDCKSCLKSKWLRRVENEEYHNKHN